MALIKCPECNKEISDECKKCPQCGYKLKKGNNGNKLKEILSSVGSIFKENKEYHPFKGKFTISAMQILALVTLICAFVISFCERCFSRKATSQVLVKSLYDPLFEHGVGLSNICHTDLDISVFEIPF